MIVFINAERRQEATAIGRALCARFQRAALIDLDNLAAITPPPEPAYVDEAASCLIAFHREQGKLSDFVVSGRFDTVEMLTRIRRLLSIHDDVTYAFRVVDEDDRLATEADEGDIGYPIPADGSTADELAAAIWDNIHEQVAVVEPDPAWAEMFERARGEISAALGDLAVGVHHIGSTAVADLPAKPVIDIMVAVRQLEPDAAGCIAPLRRLGYVFVDYPQNTDRRFYRKGLPRTHHLHIVAADSQSLQDHLAFRDALRADADLRGEYAALKRALAAAFRDDRAAYSARKTELITRALGHPPR